MISNSSVSDIQHDGKGHPAGPTGLTIPMPVDGRNLRPRLALRDFCPSYPPSPSKCQGKLPLQTQPFFGPTETMDESQLQASKAWLKFQEVAGPKVCSFDDEVCIRDHRCPKLHANGNTDAFSLQFSVIGSYVYTDLMVTFFVLAAMLVLRISF
eukprot:scaffold115476_cov26-Prasinocladus_malaysianus.AAC.2